MILDSGINVFTAFQLELKVTSPSGGVLGETLIIDPTMSKITLRLEKVGGTLRVAKVEME